MRDQIEAAGASGDRLRWRRLVVHRPWAWVWWQGHQLVAEDPDIVDHRGPRSISTTEVDWLLVFHAVRHAVGQLPPPAERLKLTEFEVETPIPLNDTEAALAQSWISEGSPVTYWYEEDLIEDGRHRLWLTRDHHGEHPVPVLATTLFYLQEARSGDLSPEVTVESVEMAYEWWNEHADVDDPEHRDVLALVHAELTAPAPVLPQWFARLPHDDAEGSITTLIDLADDGRVDSVLLERVLPSTWQQKPLDALVDNARALDLFQELGRFTYDGQPAPRPRRPLRLYRGATAEGRCGLSWTTSPDIAAHFAHARQQPGAVAYVWTAMVPPERLLAAYYDEQEFVVDLRGMEHLVTRAGQDAASDPATERHVRRRLWRQTERASKRWEKRMRRAGWL